MTDFMLCEKGGEPFNSPEYYAQPKLDGTRVFLYLNPDMTPAFKNRRGHNNMFRFPEFWHLKTDKTIVLDGELIVYNPETRKPDFTLLQQRDGTDDELKIKLLSKKYPAVFVAFDILNFGEEVSAPLEMRAKYLEEAIAYLRKYNYGKNGVGYIHSLKFFDGTEAVSLFRQAKAHGFEGIVMKKKDSIYEGKRSKNWLKFKVWESNDFVVCGYTVKNRILSALVLGAYENGKWVYKGKVGAGLTALLQERLKVKLDTLKTENPVFTIPHDKDEQVVYVKPNVIVEVSGLSGNTEKVRFPSLVRVREDLDIQIPKEFFEW